MFSRMQKAKVNKCYDYVNFLINEKRFILKIQQAFNPQQRDEQITWSNNIINSN